jgi:hydroxyacylglutathione hydrolase
MSIIEKKDLGEGRALFQMKVLEDNYTYILSWDHEAFVVDPGEGKSVYALLSEEKLKLQNILITHYHEDHTGGIDYLVKKTEAHVIGPDDPRIPGLEQTVADKEELIFGPFSIEVLATPGHTKPHIVYFFRDLHLLFSGDLLFAGGCGRLFEGTPAEMWHSLEKVIALPDDTLIYCGHEYTLNNLQFALSIEPHNQAVQKRLEEAQASVAEGRPTVPTTLALEKATNPFLRVQDPPLQKALGTKERDPAAIFAQIRTLKDKS